MTNFRPELKFKHVGQSGGFGAEYMEAKFGPVYLNSKSDKTREDEKVMKRLKKDSLELNGKEKVWVWGHLLAAKFGGTDDNRNQTILTEGGNGNSANNKHSGYELRVEKAVNAARQVADYDDRNSLEYWIRVYYKVEVIDNEQGFDFEQRLYNLSPKIPYGIRITCYPYLEPKDAKSGLKKINITDPTPRGQGARNLEKHIPCISPDQIKDLLNSIVDGDVVPNYEEGQDLYPSGKSFDEVLAARPSGIRKQHKTNPKKVADFKDHEIPRTEDNVRAFRQWKKR